MTVHHLSIVRKLASFIALGLIASLPMSAVSNYPSTPTTLAVKTIELTWHDNTRDRDVPVKIYYPSAETAGPVILFSHGLGGSREGYAYLGEYWAAHGYISVHLQHLGSDEGVWKGTLRPMKALRKAAMDPDNARNRPRDVSFAIDQLTALNSDSASPLHGRLDLAHLGLAGHSFGAYTTLVTVAPHHPLGGYDPRIRAAIAMSTPAPQKPSVYADIAIPVFHLTGTDDVDKVGSVKTAADRRIPYDQTKSAPACLLTFNGGDHMVFSGPTARQKPDAKDLRFIAFIESSTLAFWDAELRGKTDARDWLLNGDFAAALGNDGVFEKKGW
jgi:predicted dienelactone hydrolase